MIVNITKKVNFPKVPDYIQIYLSKIKIRLLVSKFDEISSRLNLGKIKVDYARTKLILNLIIIKYNFKAVKFS